MFIKVTKSGKYEYAQLVRSYREDGKVKHETVLNLGRLDHIQNNPSFHRLATRLLELTQMDNRVDISKISEAEILNWGHIVYKKLWNEFDLENGLDHIKASGKTTFNVNDTCFLMAVQHLLKPRSKLGTFNHQNRYLGLPQVKLHHLYRALTLLSKHKETLEEALFYKNRNLLNMKVDVVFYDVTTFYFESVQADSLKDFGYSKDGKVGEVQIVMGLLVDCEGQPIGYDLFPGNTFDGKTLETALDKLENRFGIRNVVIVADRGINSKLNLKKIKDKGYGYIVASRIKSMKKSVQQQIFNPQGYQETRLDEQNTIRYKVLDYTQSVRDPEKKKTYQLEEKLVITYSKTRAQKDRADRQRLLDKASFLLSEPSKIKASNKRGSKRYLKEKSGQDTTWLLDEEAIARDESYDGFYGIQTSEKELDVSKVLEHYHTLWKIEESFRIMKTNLEVRPIFCWTEHRIKGHFVICFLAFLLERTLELKLKRANEDASPDQICDAINNMCFAEVEIEKKKYYIKTKGTKLGNTILRLLRIKPFKNITPAEELTLK